MHELVQIELEIVVPATADEAFDFVADLHHYASWLGESDIFVGIQDVSDDPVRQGTTYRDRGTQMTMDGVVAIHERGQRLVMTQTGKAPSGLLRPAMRTMFSYRFHEHEAGCRIIRVYTLSGPWYLLPAGAAIRKQAVPEVSRVMRRIGEELRRRAAG